MATPAPAELMMPVSDELDMSNFEDLLGEDDRWADWEPEPDQPDPFLQF